ncbi:hypothetical protein LRS10_21730 [Phenylobacterium sp. J426]|uniref:endonuclease/exonuclease/phosphatase family protein n=1 Tax=Phenylobacterium sp. J426 TaxID=2898439 RepID=UPI0021515CE9|nr:endonuclease/exonuclease/phosphatase family protein [Phenylobacterium sp. J426]MCR5876533.1 hypothetical protein [Phenylobacterium sp. J426]
MGRNFIVVAAVALMLLGVMTRRWTPAALAAVASVLNGAALWLPAKASPRAVALPAASAPLEVATFNAARSDAAFDPFADWARKSGPEVIALVELSDDWRKRLPELVDAYPYRASRLIEGDVRQDVLSRAPIRTATVYRPTPGRTALSAEVETLHGPLQLVVLNPAKPYAPKDWTARNAYLALAGQWAAGQGGVRGWSPGAGM